MLGTHIQKVKDRRKTQQWESGIEGFLSAYVGELSLVRNPEKAFRRAIEWTPFPLREEWEKIIRGMDQGSSLDEGIARFSQKAGSPLLTRVGSGLIHLSREGVSPSSIAAITRIRDDVRAQERNTLRAFSQRLTILTLVFIAGSALIPAFVLSFITIGSTFLDTQWSPEQILLLTLVGFPLLDVVMLAWVWFQSPIPLPVEKDSTSPLPNKCIRWRERWDTILRANEIRGGWSSLFRSSVIEGASLFLVGWSAYLMIRPPGIEPLFVVGCGAVFPFFANLAWQGKRFQDETKRMEQQGLDSLLYWSALPSSWSFERKLEAIAEQSLSPIRGEWERVTHRIGKGEKVEDALASFAHERESLLLERMRRVLIQGYSSGIPLHDECARLAGEGMDRQALLDERQSSLLIEKYTLLGAGGIVVPLILGLSTGMVDQFTQGLEFDAIQPALLSAAQIGTRGYLLIYSILASSFVGLIEGDVRRFPMYAIWLLPLNQFLYWIASNYSA
ncbi:MAG: type II secretion system F family protein [archaeon]